MSITATLWIQIVVFAILVFFTMKYVWPPITAMLDERARKVEEGLTAAEKARKQAADGKAEIEKQLSAARDDAAKRLANAEHLAVQIVEEAKSKANEEAAKIVAQAHAEAQQATVKAREALRDEVAVLAVKGAEQILRHEVNASVHAELLARLKTEL